MIPGRQTVTGAYLEHLTNGDLRLLGGTPGGGPEGSAGAFLRLDPKGLDELLAGERVFEAVFGAQDGSRTLLGVSPFLTFAVAVERTARELASMTYVVEWLGPGRHAPVFDVAALREFMSAPWRRLFLAELLASYTHVASGSVLVPGRRGRRRQRFSELDPARLAGLLDVVGDAERPGVLRRLGDLALFLTGVFPDYVARRGFGQVEETRLLRAGGIAQRPDRSGPPGSAGAVGLLEQLGRRWYQGAFDLLPRPVPRTVAVLGELPERFGQARRILGLITERFLFTHRDRWFGLGGAP